MHNNKVLKRTHLFNKNKTSMYICDHSTSEYLGFYTAIKLKSIFAKTVYTTDLKICQRMISN